MTLKTPARADYVLIGETEIVLKDSSKIFCKDKIDGIK